MRRPVVQNKFKVVLERNTFFFHNDEFEENYEGYVSSITSLLLLLRDKIKQAKTNNQRKEIVIDFIRNNQDGLNALLALLGLSRETLLRLITFIRIINNPALRSLVNFSKWGIKDRKFISEIREDYVIGLIRKNKSVATGIVNLFFEGNTLPILRQTLPLFEFKKLNFSKLDFSPQSLIDTIIRYKTKGSYAAFEENNPTGFIRKILDENGIEYNANQKLKHIRRSIDFAIPNKNGPKVIVESSYVVTTSSGMGDKAKTEIQVARDIRKYYPKTTFIGFVDGIGWYVRQGDLKRIVSAFDEVFTFHSTELKRFAEFIQKFL